MKTSALIFAITALYSSGVLADHQEPLDASAYVCIRNNKVMGEDGCYKRNGVDRITHCHNAGNGHYHYSECRVSLSPTQRCSPVQSMLARSC